jgi:hypothetical protein
MSILTPLQQSPFNKSRRDKFLMSFNVPPALKQISTKDVRDNNIIIPDTLQFSVFGIIVPDIEISASVVRYGGQTLTTSSYNRNPYPPMVVNFTVDNRFNNYWVIYTWLNLFNDEKQGTFDIDNLTKTPKALKEFGISKPEDINLVREVNLNYRADISIYALDEYNKKTVQFKYIQSFPTFLGGINFNYRDGTEIETSFAFSYSQFYVSLVKDVDM